ncbi:MAG: leucine-rich repeat domain-containing protein, partial [Clostridia bacterium]|nr:leucine-rich repeat domain-containing protein [Clostridia bacterium]
MMILSIFTIAISAEETNVVESSGTVFNYTTYTVDGTTMAAITGYVSGNSDFIIPEKIGDYVVCKISSKAFNDNNVITSVVIPNCVTTIEELAFRNCDMLMSVVIPDSVTTIGDCAFENCDQLTDVVIGNSVNYWGGWCFANNPKLTNLTFNEGLVHIGKRT